MLVSKGPFKDQRRRLEASLRRRSLLKLRQASSYEGRVLDMLRDGGRETLLCLIVREGAIRAWKGRLFIPDPCDQLGPCIKSLPHPLQ